MPNHVPDCTGVVPILKQTKHATCRKLGFYNFLLDMVIHLCILTIVTIPAVLKRLFVCPQYEHWWFTSACRSSDYPWLSIPCFWRHLFKMASCVSGINFYSLLFSDGHILLFTVLLLLSVSMCVMTWRIKHWLISLSDVCVEQRRW